MSHTPYISSSYLHCMLDKREFDRRVSTARDILSKYKYDAIAFRGMSGALLAAPLAHMLDKTMIMVRKPKVDCHTSRAVEGDNAARRYIIVDDVICSGNTLRTIIRAVKRFAPAAECVGYLEWNNLYAMSHELESCERFKPSASERFDEFGVTIKIKARPVAPSYWDFVSKEWVTTIAGISARSLGDGPLHECTTEAWDTVMNVNSKGTFLMCREVLQLWTRNSRSGAILNTGSVLAQHPPGQALCYGRVCSQQRGD